MLLEHHCHGVSVSSERDHTPALMDGRGQGEGSVTVALGKAAGAGPREMQPHSARNLGHRHLSPTGLWVHPFLHGSLLHVFMNVCSHSPPFIHGVLIHMLINANAC